MHEFCGKLDCAEHGGRARREHELRLEGMQLAVDLINEHRFGFGSMGSDEFVGGLECAARIVAMERVDPLFVPPAYDECTDTPEMLRIWGLTGGERV